MNILLCTAGYLAATLITYSQESQPIAEQAALPLPADVKLVSKDGKKKSVRLLRVSPDEIITLRNGKNWPITMRHFDEESIEKLKAYMPPAEREKAMKPLTQEQQEYAALVGRVNTIIESYKGLTAKELMEKFKSNDPDLLFVINRNGYDNYLKYWGGKDPELAKRSRSGVELLRTIEIKDGDEKVSLRPAFEKLGMVAHQQVEDRCYQHATYHMYQYECRRLKLPVPSYEGFMQKLGGGKGNPLGIVYFQLNDGRKLFIQHINLGGVTVLEHELIKHQLRNGKPCVISADFPKLSGHVVLAIGFEVKNGETTFEYLDSNRVWQDKGYRSTRTHPASNIKGEISAGF